MGLPGEQLHLELDLDVFKPLEVSVMKNLLFGPRATAGTGYLQLSALMRLFIGLLAVVSLFSCAEMQKSSGKVLENAGSVFRSADKKLIHHPEGSSGSRVERSAGKVLDNAGSVVRSSNQKKEEQRKEKIDRPDQGGMY